MFYIGMYKKYECSGLLNTIQYSRSEHWIKTFRLVVITVFESQLS